MDLDFLEIIQATGGILCGPPSSKSVRKICTDSRSIQKGDVFFAISGPRYDGHDFIGQAFGQGIDHFVISNEKKLPHSLKDKASVIQVRDVLTAYGDLAKYYRKKMSVQVIAITGSCGKTTVKELVWRTLSLKHTVLKNQGTENNLVGVPKTIFELDKTHEILVLELGTNQPGEIDRLSSIAMPDMAIITQIGDSHLEGLKDKASVKIEKLSLIKHLKKSGPVFLNGEDAFLDDVTSQDHQVIRVAHSAEISNIRAENVLLLQDGTTFDVDGQPFQTKLVGRHNVVNALFALAVARNLGIPDSEITKALSMFEPVPGRMKLRQAGKVNFIDDSYNSNPTSFQASLEALKEFKSTEKKAVVCGDMLELGELSKEFHQVLGRYAATLGLKFIIAVGPWSKFLVQAAIEQGFDSKQVFHLEDSYKAGVLCRKLAEPGQLILVKGSRGMKMEKVFEAFSSAPSIT